MCITFTRAKTTTVSRAAAKIGTNCQRKEKLDDALVSLFLPLVLLEEGPSRTRYKLPFSRHMDAACFGFVSAIEPSVDYVGKSFGLPLAFFYPSPCFTISAFGPTPPLLKCGRHL